MSLWPVNASVSPSPINTRTSPRPSPTLGEGTLLQKEKRCPEVTPWAALEFEWLEFDGSVAIGQKPNGQ